VTETKWESERRELVEDGFTVGRGLLTPDEVLLLRTQIADRLRRGGDPFALGTTMANAAVQVPEISWLFSHPAIAEFVAGIVDPGPPAFTFHCDVHMNPKGIWHKDSGEGTMPGGYFGRPIFDVPGCPVVKLVVYCQEHVTNDGGLRLRRGSQHTTAHEGEVVTLRTNVGDVVAFDVRAFHRGDPATKVDQAFKKLSRRLPASVVRPLGRAVRRIELTIERRPDRLAAFFSYGSPGELTDRFAVANMERANGGEMPTPPSGLVEALAAAGIGVVDLEAAERAYGRGAGRRP
jgi:hypothetical protein